MVQVSIDPKTNRECPHCKAPLSPEDDAWLQRVIDRATSWGGFVQDDSPRQLSCAIKPPPTAHFQIGSDFWLVRR